MNFFDEIKNTIPFKDVARDHEVEFNRSNKALCPFHQEETPSFSLHPSGSFAKCFGCGIAVEVVGSSPTRSR